MMETVENQALKVLSNTVSSPKVIAHVTVQYCTVQDRTGQDRTGQYSTASATFLVHVVHVVYVVYKYCPLQYSTLLPLFLRFQVGLSMSEMSISVSPETPMSEAASIMLDARVKRLPVVGPREGEGGHDCGGNHLSQGHASPCHGTA